MSVWALEDYEQLLAVTGQSEFNSLIRVMGDELKFILVAVCVTNSYI